MKRYLRLGIRVSKLFPNVGIFVIKVPFNVGFNIIEAFVTIKELLQDHDKDLADRIVCEWRDL